MDNNSAKKMLEETLKHRDQKTVDSCLKIMYDKIKQEAQNGSDSCFYIAPKSWMIDYIGKSLKENGYMYCRYLEVFHISWGKK
jgi:hypothetical protein